MFSIELVPNNPATAQRRYSALHRRRALNPISSPSMSTHPMRILVVEDHPFQLIATEVRLNQLGYFLLTPAMTANEALQALQRSASPYDLMLCDQRLPDMSGFELVCNAHQEGLIRYAIMLSGVADEQLQALEYQALSQGLPVLGCLSKPLETTALVRLLSFLDTRQPTR